MKVLVCATIIAGLAGSCGESKRESSNEDMGFYLNKDDAAEKKWGNGDLNLFTEKPALQINYIPETSLGSVALPRCAELNPEMILGKFTCNTDQSTQAVRVKHVDQICNLSGEESQSVTASESLSSANCQTGKISYYPLNVRFGYIISQR